MGLLVEGMGVEWKFWNFRLSIELRRREIEAEL